jgi:RNA polymerase sigma-70 factor (ECF subfamily)
MAPAESSPVEILEAEQIEKARAGDARAFSDLIGKYERKIFRLAQHITQNREDAEDVLQETFLKAYEHLNQFQGNSKFYTWIVRIAVNQALMKLRKRKSDKTVSMDEGIDTGEDVVVREIAAWDEDPEQRYSREELNEILTAAVDSLAPAYRTVFVLRDVGLIHGRDSGGAGTFDSSGEEPTATSTATIAREANEILQAEGRRRICLHVRSFFPNLALIWTNRPISS